MKRPRNITKEAKISGPNSYRKPAVLCFQETMLSKQRNFNIKNDSGLFKEGHINRRAHGRVAVFIHDNIPFKEITTDTPLQAIAARLNIGIDVTVVSIYNSRSHDISENLLSTLLHQLPKPVILAGDFNSYNQIWESPENDVGGVKVLEFIKKTKHFK